MSKPKKDKFYLVQEDILPEAIKKTIKVKEILKLGEVKTINEAVEKMDLSRSAYYKYKDYIYEFSESPQGRKATFNIMIIDGRGILSKILNFISGQGGNILTINQGIPLNGYAYISLTIDISNLEGDITSLMDGIGEIEKVEKVEFIAME